MNRAEEIDELQAEIKARSVPEPNSGCWLWISTVGGDGYGVLRWKWANNKRAHRVSYEVFVGEIPTGRIVCHSCDQPTCVNPAHLFVGSQADNIADKVRKGRQAKGERNNHAKLTSIDVRTIRERADKGANRISLAAQFGVTESTIYQIIRRVTWRHL